MAANLAGRSIFISYRRTDAEGEAGRLFDDLVQAYGDASVFMDVSAIEPGADFRKAIDENVSGCGVLLAVIGPSWATVTASDGSRRLENPDDYVRLEIATALGRGIPVIPVLVHEAHMPSLDLLPDNLKDLRYRNSVELTHARWNSDVALLVAALRNYVAAVQARPTETIHATVPVQLPAPIAAPTTPAQRKLGPLYAAGGITLAILLGVGGYLASKHAGSSPPSTPSPSPPSQQTGTVAAVPMQPVSAASTAQPATSAPDPAASTPHPSAGAKLAASPVTPSAPAGSSNAVFNAFLGDWKNSKEVTANGDVLKSILIVDFGGQLVVRPRAQCPNKICNWAPKNATINGLDAVTDTWTLRNTENETRIQRTAAISMRVIGDALSVTVHNTWTDESGKPRQSYIKLQFEKGQS
jgi:hypothetical protein